MQKNIILIDDDPIIHMSCEMMFFGSVYKQISITEPEAALSFSKNKSNYVKPDLIIVDLMMGKISGINIIRSIREDSYFEETPIMLFTGYHEKIMEDEELLKELNVSFVLPKPITKEQLLSKISACIGI
jgi:CheY-like chemotaxis protein